MNAPSTALLLERADQVLLRGQILYEGRSRRERIILLLGGVALLWALADGLWINDAITRLQRDRVEAHERELRVQTVQNELDALKQELTLVEQAGRVQLQEARRRTEVARSGLLADAKGLVTAEQMTQLLQDLMAPAACRTEANAPACAPRLRVRSMRSMAQDMPLTGAAKPAAPHAASGPAGQDLAADADHPLPGLWQHGLEIVLEGSFHDLQDYMLRLESLPQHLTRGGMNLNVEQHPQATLTLRLYTLSLDPQWLEL